MVPSVPGQAAIRATGILERNVWHFPTFSLIIFPLCRLQAHYKPDTFCWNCSVGSFSTLFNLIAKESRTCQQ
ncbi:hypothetical protein XELAEV_18006813mg [Xenopus laevis]|uniref:Uncharacterized protein n=1 Tax=Xenopus laevis TaxID=8355 RepID=A0A974I439_XENLA|nr:hypothetical protein XELAEV_18006813mg [Xenopus laevis]